MLKQRYNSAVTGTGAVSYTHLKEKKEKLPDNNFNRQRVRAELGREAAEHKAQRDALRPSAVRESNDDANLQSGKEEQASSPLSLIHI